MEKNGVSRAKPAVSISKKQAKKNRKIQKKADKKAEKRQRKDIKKAYTKALAKQSPDKFLAVVAVLLAVAPIVAEYIMDKKDK